MYDVYSTLALARRQHEDRLRVADAWRLARVARSGARAARQPARPQHQLDQVAAFWATALGRYEATVGA